MLYGRRVGNLVYRERLHDPRPGRSIWLAVLLRPDGDTYVIPPLDRARIRRVKDGVLISGLEVVARRRAMKNIKSDRYPQTWWCVPLPWDRHQPTTPDPVVARAEARRRGEIPGLEAFQNEEHDDLAA
ncbi:hypothetical protein [Variovorax sp. JS1663]|uniref:hypothetical protein n=1 Tax=Variovorax sp. JS1663 TaxID=1851577 RepID=UPI00117D72AE|nr:hypothetical protein [Variovorax sp. JS1663]